MIITEFFHREERDVNKESFGPNVKYAMFTTTVYVLSNCILVSLFWGYLFFIFINPFFSSLDLFCGSFSNFLSDMLKKNFRLLIFR